MTSFTDLVYWMAISQLPRWTRDKINKLSIQILLENKIKLEDFFNLDQGEWEGKYGLNKKEISELFSSKNDIPNYSFLAEELLNQGYEIIPINSPEYSKTLKINLKTKYSPPLLYVKGNKNILQEYSVAVVGSRETSEIALKFTDNIAKKASEEYKVVVSGFAKGVDKQALDSTISYIGQSIIVLPQGIMTFEHGFNKYYKQIVDGDVLVLSIFHPKAPWSIQFAMARNPIIYGLAKDIFVAESKETGGTWSGVLDGLRKGRTIYVRFPEQNEKNANKLLIENGAVAVDFNGIPLIKLQEVNIENVNKDTSNLELSNVINKPSERELFSDSVKTEDIVFESFDQEIELKIFSLLKSSPLTSKKIIDSLHLNIKPRTLTTYLKNNHQIEVIRSKDGIIKFSLKEKTDEIFLF